MSDRTTSAAPPWLPLLRRLTEALPRWAVWKNADSALSGTGDVDAVAPPGDRDRIAAEFRDWAAGHGLGPVVVCTHIRGGVNLVAVPPGRTHLLEMGVKSRKIWRGATLFTHPDLEPLTGIEPRGFRALRPGAEGLFKLLLNGLRWDGAPDEAALAVKGVRALLAADPDGVRRAARLLGRAAAPAGELAEAAAAGGWDRRAALAVQGWTLARALTEPGVALSRARFRLSGRRPCPVVATLLGDRRRIPADREAWLARVAESHTVWPAGG